VIDVLFAHLRGQAVHAVARLRTRQAGVQVIDLDGPLAEVRLNTTTVLDGRRARHTFAELDMRPLTGKDSALGRLEQALRAAGAVDGDARPPVWQALGRAFPSPLPDIAADAPLAEQLKHMLQTQVHALLQADPGTRLGTDPEDLHQMRVATRRLRAYLRAARPILIGEWAEAIRNELTWLGSMLGPVRDGDVLLERLRTESAGLPAPERRAFVRLLPVLEVQRASDRATMLTALRSERYLRLLTQLEGPTPGLEVATITVALSDLAAAAFKRLRKAMRALDAEASPEELHRVRIAGKRARYAAELAEAAVGKPATRFLQQTKVLQDLLGEHQDAMVAETHLRALLRHTRGRLAAFTIGRLVERMQASRRSVRATLPDAWATLAKHGRKAWSQATDAS
jgi:CHAD domain-containing protein